jgi:hypothetical protein
MVLILCTSAIMPEAYFSEAVALFGTILSSTRSYRLAGSHVAAEWSSSFILDSHIRLCENSAKPTTEIAALCFDVILEGLGALCAVNLMFLSASLYGFWKTLKGGPFLVCMALPLYEWKLLNSRLLYKINYLPQVLDVFHVQYSFYCPINIALRNLFRSIGSAVFKFRYKIIPTHGVLRMTIDKVNPP